MKVDTIGPALIVGMALCMLAGGAGVAIGFPDLLLYSIGAFTWLLLIDRVHRILLFLKEEFGKTSMSETSMSETNIWGLPRHHRAESHEYSDPDLDIPYAPPKEFRLRG